MGNVLPSDRRLHRKYDLKGSRWNRSVGPERLARDPDVVLKDLDLDLRVRLGDPGCDGSGWALTRFRYWTWT